MVEVPFGFDPTSYSHIEGALKIVQAVVFLVKITKWMEPAEVDVVNSFKSVIGERVHAAYVRTVGMAFSHP